MDADFLKLLQEKVDHLREISQNEKKRSVFCLASTKNKAIKNYYFTALRVSEQVNCLCLMVQDLVRLEEILREVDGSVDFFLYDAEMKFAGFEKISSLIEGQVKKSRVLSFLGNTITTQAVVSSLQNHLRRQGKNFVGLDVLIYGSGHLGTSIAAELIDYGCRVGVIKRDLAQAQDVARALNLLKSPHATGEARAVNPANQVSFDVLLGCASEPKSLGLEIVRHGRPGALYMDVGISNFSPEALTHLSQQAQVVYMTNILNSFLGHLHFLLKDTKDLASKESRETKDFTLFRSGLIAPKGSLVVDDVNNPQVIYGLSNGDGSLTKVDEAEVRKKISQ